MTFDALMPLFNRLGVEYLTSNRYFPLSLGRFNVTRTLYYRRNRTEFEHLAAKYSEALNTGKGLPELEIRYIGGLLGYGLYTLDSIKSGELIGEYTGEVRRPRPGRPIPGGGFTSDYSWGFPRVHIFGRDLEIDAREAGGPLRFANHVSGTDPGPSAEPDHFPSGRQWRVIFTARLPIEAGGEITVDYGDAYWNGGEREMI